MVQGLSETLSLSTPRHNRDMAIHAGWQDEVRRDSAEAVVANKTKYSV